MKNVFVLLALFLSFTNLLIAQNANEENSLFTPDQLKEDVDYFFKTLFERHPNPYEYSSLFDFESKKDNIYSQLDRPMTADEFMWIIGSMDSYLDYHSGINLKFNRYIIECYENAKENNLKLFPSVSIRDGKIYTKIQNQEQELITINGIPADSISRFMQFYFNNKLSIERNTYYMESFFALWIDLYFKIKPPFRVMYKGYPTELQIEGVSADEFMDFSSFGIVRKPLVKYAIYPVSSVAIFTAHVFNRNKMTPAEMESQIAAFRDSINKYDIKHVFVDLSKNTGGVSSLSYPLLNIFPHDTIFERYTSISKKELINDKNTYKFVAQLPQLNPYKSKDKQFFVLQGTNTISAANYLCRMIRLNRLGVLVGQPSGEPTREFTGSMTYKMPNTKLTFSVATSLIDFSDYFPQDEKNFPPDMYWDVDYTIDFTEEELVKIVKQWNK
jgi:hypothetical protein